MKKITAVLLAIAFLLSVHDGPSRAQAQTGLKWLFVMTGQSGGQLLCPYLETAIVSYYGPDSSLICAAVPGSALSSWQPGQPNYVTAVDAVNDARQLDGYVFKALLVSNGESDAWLLADAQAFTGRMATFVDTFRIDTGNAYTFVVYSQLGRRPVCAEQNNEGYPQWELVRAALHNFRYNRANAKMVELLPFTAEYAPGLPCSHLTPAMLQAAANQYMINLRGWIPAP